MFYNNMYITSYCNIHAYGAGVIVGFLYHYSRNENLNLDNSKLYSLMKKASVPMAVFGLFPAYLYYEYDIPRSSWLTMLQFVLFHNYGIVVVSLCLIYCIRHPPGPIRQVLSSRVMTTLGKLSYSVYVLHIPLLRWILNYTPVMIDLSFTKIFLLITGTVIASYLLGLVVYLVIEQPINLLLKHWLIDRTEHGFKVKTDDSPDIKKTE
ncbi:uncharacterized protein LOC131438551 [Malaya genurostris]|uniref:uncharacterized protein LOC131438551 n=1 Tax=Malaya genurostris TaxID=325434 RepID=UPI0026F3A455|nr:uncharacterized protein LOC131438551 [Malaya genurostris]